MTVMSWLVPASSRPHEDREAGKSCEIGLLLLPSGFGDFKILILEASGDLSTRTMTTVWTGACAWCAVEVKKAAHPVEAVAKGDGGKERIVDLIDVLGHPCSLAQVPAQPRHQFKPRTPQHHLADSVPL